MRERGDRQSGRETDETRDRLVRYGIVPLLVLGGLAWLVSPAATPVIPPRYAVVWGLAATGALAMWPRRWGFHLASVVLFVLAAEHLVLTPGSPRGHDTLPHTWGVWAFFSEVHAGDWTPQWLHRLNLGLPLPTFYAPGTYYAMTPFFLLGLSSTEILEGAFLVHALLGALAMYCLGWRWTGNSRAGVIAAAAFAFAPFRLLSAHYRLALGETAGLAILAILLALVFDPSDWTRRRIAATAVAVAALILSHPLSPLIAALPFLLWQLVEWRQLGGALTRRRVARRLLAGLLGLALAAFYWVPMVQRQPDVALDYALYDEATGALRLSVHGLRWQQPFERLPWDALRGPEPLGTPNDRSGAEAPVYAGFVLLGCLLVAGVSGFRLRGGGSDRARLEWTIAIVALGALLGTFHLSARGLVALPAMAAIQFPWRLLGPLTLLGAVAAAFAAQRLIESRRTPWVALLLALIVADGAPFTGAAEWVPEVEGLAHFNLAKRGFGEGGGRWRAEVLTPPYPLRVEGSFLPPTAFGSDVGNLWSGYGEYLNRDALASVKRAMAEGRSHELGAAWTGRPDQPGARIRPAAPFAQWRPSAAGALGDGARRPFRLAPSEIVVTLPGETGSLTLLAQYNRGWEARLDGRSASIEATEDGLMRIHVEAPADAAHLRYRLTGWDVWLGRGASVLGLVLLLWLHFARPADRVATTRQRM